MTTQNKIRLAEVLGFFILPWFCIFHAWTTSPKPSIKPWPSGTENVGPHRILIDTWKWDRLNTWYDNIEDGVSGQDAYVWESGVLVPYHMLFPHWMPIWCIAIAWSVWRNGANNAKRPERHDTFAATG